jgi:DNA-binding transcriptional LysR family regulator
MASSRRESQLWSGVLPFVRVAEEGSFRSAAARLGVTPAAVSKAIARLEGELGVALFQRTSRTVTLTPEGAVFLPRCRDALASLDAGRALVSAARRRPRGEVHLSLPFILGEVVIPALPELAARHPALTFRVSMTDRLVRLADERVDVAVRIGPLPDSTAVARRLRATRWVTVAAPALVGSWGEPARPEELLRMPCLRFLSPNGRARPFVFAGEVALDVDGPLVIDQGEHLLRAAVAGLGVAQVLDFMVGEHLRDGRLVELLAPVAAPGPDVHALSPPERARTPNARALVEFLVALFRRAA